MEKLKNEDLPQKHIFPDTGVDGDNRTANNIRQNIEQRGNTGENPADRHSENGEITSKDIDAGGVRTAAFDMGNEPRSKESTSHRGATQGSED